MSALTATLNREPVINAPVILDLGKASRKKIRQLREGHGELVDEVQSAMHEVTASLGAQVEGKQLVPVVLIYRKKSRRRKGAGRMFPLVF